VGRSVNVITTARETGERLTSRLASFHDASTPSGPSIVVDDNVRYQTIEGFGGAFTESAATTLLKMSPARQEEILAAYFGPSVGHGYTLCRTHINSCDFSLGNYAYDETPGDVDLCDFTIDRDRQVLLPMIHRAQRMSNNSFKLFASPWSPPAWMKTTGEMNRGGKLLDEYRQTWAKYFARYIREYEREGVPIWGVTIQNEPEAVQSWDSCIYTADEERIFVREFLGPVLEAEGLGRVKIIIWDHNRDELFLRAKGVLDDPLAAKYVWGVGFHWYVADKFDNIQLVHDAYPDFPLLLTEACVEHGAHEGDWSSGEKYARSIIQDLNHWAVGWVDWNMLLDEKGGPNHVGNYCSAPIIADTTTDTVHYQSSYYYLGHFARYIRHGARRVLCSTNRDELEATAFVNVDGRHVVVALNRTDTVIEFDLWVGSRSTRTILPAHGIATLTWE
jgi:glucosylceramidase